MLVVMYVLVHFVTVYSKEIPLTVVCLLYLHPI